MELINYIASIFGFSLVVIPLAVLVNPKHLDKLVMQLENNASTFLWGIVAFVIGSAMLLNYNVWSSDWTVVITIFGWLSVLKGISLLFFPSVIKRHALKIVKSQWISTLLVVAVFIGLALIYFSFTA